MYAGVMRVAQLRKGGSSHLGGRQHHAAPAPGRAGIVECQRLSHRRGLVLGGLALVLGLVLLQQSRLDVLQCGRQSVRRCFLMHTFVEPGRRKETAGQQFGGGGRPGMQWSLLTIPQQKKDVRTLHMPLTVMMHARACMLTWLSDD